MPYTPGKWEFGLEEKEMLNLDALKEKAQAQFRTELVRLVNFITATEREGCWIRNLKAYLQDLSRVLESGKKLGVFEGDCLTEQELEELMKDLEPLKILGMVAEARGHLADQLIAKGVDPAIFGKPQTAEAPTTVARQ